MTAILCPVKILINHNDTRIREEFLWNLNEELSPFVFAQQFIQEIQGEDELIPIVVEQINNQLMMFGEYCEDDLLSVDGITDVHTNIVASDGSSAVVKKDGTKVDIDDGTKVGIYDVETYYNDAESNPNENVENPTKNHEIEPELPLGSPKTTPSSMCNDTLVEQDLDTLDSIETSIDQDCVVTDFYEVEIGMTDTVNSDTNNLNSNIADTNNTDDTIDSDPNTVGIKKSPTIEQKVPRIEDLYCQITVININ